MSAFSLEKLLQVRRWKLKRLQGDLESLKASEAEWQACVKAIEQANSQADRLRRERWEAYRQHLEPRVEELKEKQEEVAASLREVKMFEKLKEKHYHRLHLRESKRETAFLDEAYRRHQTGR